MNKILQTQSFEKPPIIGVGTFTATPLAKQLVMEVLDSNRLSYGPMLQKFEIEFSEFLSKYKKYLIDVYSPNYNLGLQLFGQNNFTESFNLLNKLHIKGYLRSSKLLILFSVFYLK